MQRSVRTIPSDGASRPRTERVCEDAVVRVRGRSLAAVSALSPSFNTPGVVTPETGILVKGPWLSSGRLCTRVEGAEVVASW